MEQTRGTITRLSGLPVPYLRVQIKGETHQWSAAPAYSPVVSWEVIDYQEMRERALAAGAGD